MKIPSDHQTDSFRQIAVISGAVAVFLGITGLSGWIWELRFLTTLGSAYIPIASSTCIAFLVQGSILILRMRCPSCARNWPFAALATATSVFGLLTLAGQVGNLDLNLEWATFSPGEQFGLYPSNRMSPLTGALFCLTGAALLLLVRYEAGRLIPHIVSALASIATMVGLVGTISHMYGIPLLYGTSMIPMALGTSTAFIFLGAGLLAAAGPEGFLLRPLTGSSVCATLLRTFVPLGFAAVICSGILQNLITKLHSAFVSGVSALFFGIVTAVIVVRAARTIGNRIETAETERKRAEDALRDSQERLHLALESGKAGIWDRDILADKSVWDDYSHALFGLEPGAFSGKLEDFLGMLHPDDRKRVRGELTAAFIENADYATTYRVVWPDSSVHFIADRGRTHRDGTGRAVHITGVTWDFTELHHAEEALRESEERLRLTLEATNDGIWDWNLQTGGTVFSPRWYTMLGYEPYELPENYDTMKSLLHPDDADRVEREISAHIANREDYAIEMRMRTKAGGWQWILTRGGVVERDAGGNPVRMVGTHIDITERKRAEDEKAQLEAQLREAVKMEAVGKLAGGIAHDFNNILGIILGFSELILMNLSDKTEIEENVKEIKSAASRASVLVRQLLAFGRKQLLEPKIFNLNQTVAETKELLSRTIGEDIELVLILAPDLHKTRIDPNQLDQVLMNLAINSRDAMPNGGKLTIETRNAYLDEAYSRQHMKAKPGSYVMVGVSDTGIGMEDDIRERIFEPFFTTKEVGKGTGLGLASVYGTVQQSGGYISVYSETGKGATFEIYLPAVTEDTEVAKEAESHTILSTSRAETILLVEDDEKLRTMILRVLEKAGYNILLAANGIAAEELATKYHEPIHLVVTDVVMPGMTGRQLALKLQSLKPEARIIYMSGYDENAIVHRGELDSEIAFIAKPFSPTELIKRVREELLRG